MKKIVKWKHTQVQALLRASLVGLGHLKPITVLLICKHTQVFFFRILIEIVHFTAPYPKH